MFSVRDVRTVGQRAVTGTAELAGRASFWSARHLHGNAINFIMENTMQKPKETAIIPEMQPQTVRYVVYAQDGAFLAQCLDVDVASEGDTEEEAVINLREALELYFDAGAPEMTPSRAVRFGEIVIHA